MVTYEQLFEEALGVSFGPINESVAVNKTRIDAIVKDILRSYSDNGIGTHRNGKVKLKLKNSKLERNIYTGDISYNATEENVKYFKSITSKIREALRVEGFKSPQVKNDGSISIELTREDNNRISKNMKDDTSKIASAGTAVAAKALTGGIL